METYYPTRPEFQKPLPERSNWHGSESSTLETAVYFWCYAFLVVHDRKEEDEIAEHGCVVPGQIVLSQCLVINKLYRLVIADNEIAFSQCLFYGWHFILVHACQREAVLVRRLHECCAYVKNTVKSRSISLCWFTHCVCLVSVCPCRCACSLSQCMCMFTIQCCVVAAWMSACLAWLQLSWHAFTSVVSIIVMVCGVVYMHAACSVFAWLCACSFHRISSPHRVCVS